MNAPIPIMVGLCMAVALLTIQIPRYLYGAPASAGRHASIDGLRGYLAFFVFLHHAAIWQAYVRSGSWDAPSGVFWHLGQTSVLVFFMITGFLFMGKLIRATDAEPVDWLKLFTGRLLRLGPLYAAAMAVLSFLVICNSGFTLQQEPAEMAGSLLRWAGFTVFGQPDINGVRNTGLMMAGVTWTLPYEWMLYLALPAVAMAMRRRTPPAMTAAALLMVGVMLIDHHRAACLLAFAVGMGSAYLVRIETFRRFATGRLATVLVTACVVIAVFCFDGAHRVEPKVLIAIAFALIAGGNSLWGVLTTATSRLLGECSYGLYLLHGFVLYIGYRFVVGLDVAAEFSPMQHWWLIMACTPVLVLVADAAFRCIEAPTMGMTDRAAAMLRLGLAAARLRLRPAS